MNFSTLCKITVIAAVMSSHLHAQNVRVKNPEVFTKPSISWGESTQDPTASNRGGPATITQAYTVTNGSYTKSYYQDEAKPAAQRVTATGSPGSKLSEQVSSCGNTHWFAGPEDMTFKVTLTYTDPTEGGGGQQATVEETKKVDIKFTGRGGRNRTRSDGSVIDGPDGGPPGNVIIPGGGNGGGYHDCNPPFSPGEITPNETLDTRKSSILPPALKLEMVSENITVKSYKYGWDSYTPTDPPKRFSIKEVITRAEGGDQESPVGGYLAELINRPDGQIIRIAQGGNPSYYGVPPGSSRTETTLEHSFPVDGYDDCPNERADTRATMFVKERLGEEYKTPAFKTAAFGRAFKFKGLGFYSITPAEAKLLVSKNELDFEFKKTKYKFRIPADPIAFPRPYKVSWLEVFTPEDPNPADDQFPEKTCKAFSEEIGVGQTETQEKTIDPSETPDKEGTWEVVPVEVSLRAAGNIEPSPENDSYQASKDSAGGTDVLGSLPMGTGRGDFPGQAYTAPIQVIGKVPDVANVNWRWKRLITRRSWTITKNAQGTGWTVTQRTKRGAPPPPDDDTGSAAFNDDTRSQVGNIYIYDCSALLPAMGAVTSVGDFVYEEKQFTYQIETDAGGGDWKKAAELDVGQAIIAKRTAEGNTAAAFQGVENSNKVRKLDAVATETEVRNIVGGSLPITFGTNANN